MCSNQYVQYQLILALDIDHEKHNDERSNRQTLINNSKRNEFNRTNKQ